MSNLATIVNNILADSGIDDINVVVTNGSYSNPAWITALSWSKITSTPTTLSGYGITDAVPAIRTITINGTAQDLSANRSWSVGTVTSVDMTVPTGFAISGRPITSSGTLALTFSAGYSLPTTAVQSNWTTAYNDSIISAAVSGTTTKTLTLTQQDGGTITASWTDYDTAPVTSVNAGTGISVNQTTGAVTVTNTGTLTVAGTTNQVLVNGGTAATNGNITLSLPQSIGTSNTPTFGGLVVSGTETRQINLVLPASYNGTGYGNLIERINFPWYSEYWDIGVRRGGASDIQSMEFWLNGTTKMLELTTTSGLGYLGGNTILTSANYNSYAPTLTGGGASGTWSINVTGTAASETLATVTGRGNTTGNNIITSGNMYAEVFYDYSNNGYYMDLAGTSNIYSLNSNRVQVTNDITSSGGQGRFGGWYTGTGFTGAALEVGFSGGAGNVIAYNRQASAYQPLYIAGSNLYLRQSGGLVWINSQLVRESAGVGWLSGNYASSETAATTGAIYSIGGSYYPTGTLLNSMYGVGYTHTAQGQMISGANSWGFYVAGNGTVRVWLGGDNGNIIASGDIYANTSSIVATQTWVSTNYAQKNGSTANAFSVLELTYPQTQFNPSAGARTTLSPMSMRMWDNYFAGIGLGSDYGTVMQYYSRGGHVDTQVYFDAAGGSWYRTAAYASGFGSWQKYVTENGGTWSINITGTAASETLSTVTNRGNSTGTSIYIDQAGEGFVFRTSTGWGGWARNTHVISTSANTTLAAFGGYGGSGTSLSYSFIGIDYLNNWIRFSSSAVNSQVALQQEGNQVLHAGNYSSYALPLTGGTITGDLTISASGSYPLRISSTQRYMMQVRNTNNTVNSGYGWWWFMDTNFNMGFHADGAADRMTLTRDGNMTISGTSYAYAFRGTSNVDGTGEASFHPAGIYSTGNNWLYGTLYLAGSNIRSVGGIGQGNTLSRPNTQWGATSATGPVVIKFPGNSSNYGMVHAVIDIYEYNGNNVSTVIVGGHNWASYWVNYGANVIGYTDKPVRVAFKDGQYCIVIGNSGSSWSYGQVVLRKIQNGTYYSGSMEIVSGITIGIESDSYSWVSGDLRQLRVPGNIYMNEALVATQSWVNSQGFVTGGPFVPAKGVTNWNDNTVINNVVGMLGWKNYGGNHVIFDASASTAPNGVAISNTDAQNAWTGTYPTLMGWNGSNTYGVRVDRARLADTANALDGYSRGNTTNTIAYWSSTRNLYVNNPESYSGEVRLGAAWDRGGVYAQNTLSLSTSSTEIHFVFSNATKAYFNSTGNLYVGQGTAYSSIFMGDSDEGQRELHCNSNRIGFLNSSGSWGSWCEDNGSWYSAVGVWAPAFFDSDNDGYYANFANSSVSVNINGAILSNSSFGTNGWGTGGNAAAGRVYGPKGAAYSFSGGGINGAIKIRLPFRNSDGMWSMKVRIYNYAQQQTSEYLLGNYSYDQGAYNFSATYLGGSSSTAFTVRFGNEGGYDCVWIGETGTGWSYPVVSVMDFMMGYSNGNVSNYYQNWDISIVGSFGTVGATVAPNIRFGNAFASYYYDSADSNYYVRPSSLSYMHTVSSFYVQNNYGVSTDHAYGIYFDSGRSTAYAIYRESGAWDFPYPDLRIAFHTGIKIGANASYKGVRFYTDYDMSGLVLSVNNADYNTGGIYVHGTAYASAYYEWSDARVKKILEDNSRVKGIESIKPKLYEKDGKTEFGYIAQDFLDIMPYAINNDNVDGYYSLVYREVHTAKIAYLEDSIEEIKAKILYLENQLKTKQ